MASQLHPQPTTGAPGMPRSALVGVVSKLLGRAVGACLASSSALGEHTVVLELQQRPQTPGRLGLRVCDNGLPLPAEQSALERCVAGLALAPLLATPLFLDSTLLGQATGLEEAVVRRYSLRAPGGAQPLAVVPTEAAAKPPGSGLRGTVVEATVLLQQPPQQHPDAAGPMSRAEGSMRQPLGDVGAAQPIAAHLPASAEEVVGCLQQLLGMLRVLAPPVRLVMRLDGVLLQPPDSSLQPVTGSRRMDLMLSAALGPLARFREGMVAEFLPPQTPQAGVESVLDDSALMSGGSQDSSAAAGDAGAGAGGEAAAWAAAGEGGSGARRDPAAQLAAAEEAAPAAAAAVAAEQPPPLLAYVGVGEAGWGCPGAAQQFRGCKWSARCGLVLRMPDHARLRQQAGQAAQQAQHSGTGASGEAAGDRSGPGRLPVYLFRSWGMQMEGQAQALKGLSKVDWPNFGFQLLGAPQGGADGVLAATLCCAQPASGAQLEAAVVHLAPSEHRGAAESGKAPGLAAGYESRLVRDALEGALQQLKQQCPAVVSSRRERSLGRALPMLSAALAGILLASEHACPDGSGDQEEGEEGSGSALQQACTMVGCQPEGLESALGRLLQDTVADALGATAAAEGGSKRPRKPPAAAREGSSQSQA